MNIEIKKMFGGGARFLNNALRKNKKLLAVTVILIVTVFMVMLNNSYAYFEESVEGSCVSLEVGSLAHTLKSEVTVASGESEKIKVVVSNVDNVASKYQLVYSSNDDLTDVVVGYSNKSTDLPYGDLAKNEEKYVTIIVQNNSDTEKTVYIDVRGGLPNNSVEDIILEDGEYRITEEIKTSISIEDIVLTKVDITTTIDFSQISSETNGRGIYKYTEDGKDIYYWRGKVDATEGVENHVLFAGYCWEMVRTTKTGGLKIIYDGEPILVDGKRTCPNTGEASVLSVGNTAFNSSYDSNAYAGYMYGLIDEPFLDSAKCIKLNSAGTQAEIGSESTKEECIINGGKWATTDYEATHANVVNSTIKGVIDTWFGTSSLNIQENLEKIEDTVYCNDRTIVDDGYSYGIGVGINETYYAASGRRKPMLECNQENDRFTVSNDIGNGDLMYPVGLLTLDEMILAGGVVDYDHEGVNSDYYLYNGGIIWSMTPDHLYPYGYGSGQLYLYRMLSDGYLNMSTTDDSIGIRPVISLDSETTFAIGTDGTSTNPYVVQ